MTEMKELNDLIQEIVDFGDVIAYSENPGDPNFQHACALFSSYLDIRYKELMETYAEAGDDVRTQIYSRAELTRLNDLITPPPKAAIPYIDWTRNLFKYCTKLQNSKSIAA